MYIYIYIYTYIYIYIYREELVHDCNHALQRRRRHVRPRVIGVNRNRQGSLCSVSVLRSNLKQTNREELVYDCNHALQRRRRHVRPPTHEQRAAGGRQGGEKREERQQRQLVVLRLEQQWVGHHHQELAHGGSLGHESWLRELSNLHTDYTQGVR